MKGNVIVGQSGGPTAAINSSLAGVYRTAKDRGAKKVYGMLHGIQGLLKERYIDLSEHITNELDVELLKRTPAAYLGSCRYKLPEIHENRDVYEKIFEILNKLEIEAFIYIGGNDSTREDMAGWLGDAVLKTAKDENGVKHVSFTQDDYKADLDAENIMNIVKTEGISYQDAHQKYFERLKNGETRATIFLSHTSLEYVEKTIFEHLDVETLDELKEEEPDTYNFILNLQNGTNEWRDYR